jgi:hypothetical protein
MAATVDIYCRASSVCEIRNASRVKGRTHRMFKIQYFHLLNSLDQTAVPADWLLLWCALQSSVFSSRCTAEFPSIKNYSMLENYRSLPAVIRAAEAVKYSLYRGPEPEEKPKVMRKGTFGVAFPCAPNEIVRNSLLRRPFARENRENRNTYNPSLTIPSANCGN